MIAKTFKQEYESEECITIEVAKMQQPYKFRYSHIAYLTITDETREKEPKSKKKF